MYPSENITVSLCESHINSQSDLAEIKHPNQFECWCRCLASIFHSCPWNAKSSSRYSHRWRNLLWKCLEPTRVSEKLVRFCFSLSSVDKYVFSKHTTECFLAENPRWYLNRWWFKKIWKMKLKDEAFFRLQFPCLTSGF